MPTTLPRRGRARWRDVMAPLAFAALPVAVLLLVVMFETGGRPAAADFVVALDRAAISIGVLESGLVPAPDRRGRARRIAHAALHRSDR